MDWTPTGSDSLVGRTKAGDTELTLRIKSICKTLETNEMMSTLNKVVLTLTKDLIVADSIDLDVGASLVWTAPSRIGPNSTFSIWFFS